MIPGQMAKGSEAVTRDPDGNLQVKLRTPLNRMDEAYNHGAISNFVAQGENDRRFSLHHKDLANFNLPRPPSQSNRCRLTESAAGCR